MRKINSACKEPTTPIVLIGNYI